MSNRKTASIYIINDKTIRDVIGCVIKQSLCKQTAMAGLKRIASGNVSARSRAIITNDCSCQLFSCYQQQQQQPEKFDDVKRSGSLMLVVDLENKLA